MSGLCLLNPSLYLVVPFGLLWKVKDTMPSLYDGIRSLNSSNHFSKLFDLHSIPLE